MNAERPRPHSMMSADPVSDRHTSPCNVFGCPRGSGRFVFVCSEHWLLIEAATRTALVEQWERYVRSRRIEGQEELCREALFRFYSIARRDALPQIRERMGLPRVLAEAHA